jgi:hypothetical protein
MLEDLFGSSRAEAKRAIAQTRSLGKNVSHVMKLRTDVRADLADYLDAVPEPPPVDEPAPRRGLAWGIALVMLLAIVGGVGFLVWGGEDRPVAAKPVASAVLQIESEPPGAAISLGGEPTGLKTPATLNAVTARQVLIRVDLDGYTAVTENVAVPRTGTTTKRFTLTRAGD